MSSKTDDARTAADAPPAHGPAPGPTQDPANTINSLEDLEALYGEPLARSLVKEIDHINAHYRRFIEHSPFVVIASCGPEGLDCSPRGDPPGFVRVHDDRTVLIPDRRGNNRIDTLRNIIRDPRISLLFLVPGAGETLRINGRASIRVDPALLESFSIQGKPPRSVLEVSVDRVYFQCQKALARSRLWQPEAQVAKGTLPSAGQILQALSTSGFDGEAYDRDYPEHMRKTIY
ncbi:MAG: pyridoxamine 5'-phosphate oxidase family protein [Gammaproteobacteria bacterium]|nr:pyridoxamine 5'-phosphate oxidase family protein [Gammaproteobacteria bacterium]